MIFVEIKVKVWRLIILEKVALLILSLLWFTHLDKYRDMLRGGKVVYTRRCPAGDLRKTFTQSRLIRSEQASKRDSRVQTKTMFPHKTRVMYAKRELNKVISFRGVAPVGKESAAVMANTINFHKQIAIWWRHIGVARVCQLPIRIDRETMLRHWLNVNLKRGLSPA